MKVKHRTVHLYHRLYHRVRSCHLPAVSGYRRSCVFHGSYVQTKWSNIKINHRPAHLYHRLNHRVWRCHLHLPAISGYCMTATCSTCLCMLVYLLCTYTWSACRNGHTCKPTIPRHHIVMVATASSEWRSSLPSSSIHPYLVGSVNVGWGCRHNSQLAA